MRWPSPWRAAGVFASPADRDLMLAIAAFADDATPDQIAEFERRYVEDDAFHFKVLPLVHARLLHVDWRRFANPSGSPNQAHVRRSWRLIDMVLATGAAAAVLTAAAWIGSATLYMNLFDPGPDPVVTYMPARAKQPSRSAAPAPAGTKQPSPAAVPEPSRDSMRSSITTLKILDVVGKETTADSAHDAHVDLRGGSSVTVRAGSSVRHAALPMASRGDLIEVRGEAAIVVTRGDLIVKVVSRGGTAMLVPGRYALRCVGACDALEVTVAAGSATISNDWLPGTEVRLAAGEFGLAPRDDAPRKVPADSAGAFPRATGAASSAGRKP